MSKHDPMEELFRDRAEKYDYPFEEKDWEALEARLDYEMPQRGGNFIGYLLIGFLLISLPFWPWSINSSPSTQQRWEDSNSDIEESSMPNSSNDNAIANPTFEEHATPEMEVERSTMDVSPAVSEPKTITASNPKSTPSGVPSSIDAPKKLEMNPQQEVNTEPTSPKASTISVNEPNVVDASGNNEDPEQLSGEYLPTTDSAFSKLENERLEANEDEYVVNYESEPIAESPALNSESDSLSNEIISPQTSTRRRWNFFVLAGAEKGGTQLNRLTRFGWRAGFGVRYSPLSSLSINTGINFSQLGYTAWEEEYDLKDYELPYGDELAWTDGSCNMIEIPLEVRYHPVKWMNIGAGIRSYYVQQEEYNFHYESRYNEDYTNNYVNKTNAFSWVSHAVFSLGFNVPVYGKQLEIQPFYQMPIKGIGQGEVEWQSYGVSILYLF
ncbi:porin family protein [Phaeocystidibacter marisrubri]|uniref:PorT family protein n=1 Tax=Phaeocystidibacter marisrubri TaxID=1577780 RepID=A0A6L3ZJS1_9FLAO|nr:hypothetical protein [Phaeocystidibacter marisrubri]KAB2817380.1 hypothetical protein F8C82_03010 [Phaeocystidibacter marisrubri]GGH75640.1 hypothetical protein GCM10011318_22870 [Phaeocystidibacter marisrubri]